MDAKNAERIGRNDAAFRGANEQIRARAMALGKAEDQPLPFICECADEDCTTILQLPLVEYEFIRADSRHFLNAVGHERAEGPVEIVTANHDHLVVRKSGRAGEIAEALDTRRHGHRAGIDGR